MNGLLFLLLFGPGPIQNACKSVTLTELERAVGKPQRQGVDRAGASHTACEFETSEGLVSVELHTAAASVTLQSQADALTKAFPNASFHRLTLAGSPGFAMNLPDTGTQIHILTADRTYILISVLGYPNSGDAALSVARSILGRRAVPRP